jgi:prephenate dehydrogenase
MKVGICGLGLIGGSAAWAYKNAGHTVLGFDKNDSTMSFAYNQGIIDEELDEKTIKQCDLILIALYPAAAAKYLESIAPSISKTTTVIDLCGTKKNICKCGFALAERYGFTFVGGHPMAGTQFSGIEYSRSDLFCGAPMVIVPPRYDDTAFLEDIKKLLEPCGFGMITVTTAEEHDRIIAFTSQLAHVVSNAYVKTPTAQMHKGFSAGSYKDLTRVAWLNEYMWADLFLENKEPLLFEIDSIIASLAEYRDAIAEGNEERLIGLLRDGRIAKEKVDG